jgi:O-acetyl-ADP-ribose deacetylase (regulator of RNase III)
MSIVYEGYGNVLTHSAQTLTCPVNTVAVMGAGLALAMRNRIPGLNEFYKGLCYQGTLVLGECCVYPIPDKSQQILLFPTKGHWKETSKKKYIEQGLQFLAQHYEALNITSLAMVPLGCGLGALDFTKTVKPLIHTHLDPLPIDVHLLHRQTDED